MQKIKLTKEEVDYLRGALNFYCDDTTHERKDLPKEDGLVVCSPGLNPKSRESKVLDNIRKKLNGGRNSSQS